MTSEQKRKLHAGTTFDVLACDEKPGWSHYDESKRGLRGAKGGGRVLWAFTPLYEEGRGPSWSKERILDAYEGGELPKTKVIRAKMTDNPVVTKDYIAEFMRGKTDEQIRVQMLGEYPTFGKMCFPDFRTLCGVRSPVKVIYCRMIGRCPLTITVPTLNLQWIGIPVSPLQPYGR